VAGSTFVTSPAERSRDPFTNRRAAGHRRRGGTMLRTATDLLEKPQFTWRWRWLRSMRRPIAPSWSGRFQAARCSGRPRWRWRGRTPQPES